MVRYNRIENWIHNNHFPDRESAETYIKIHGGWSSGVEQALDFVFGNKQNVPDFIEEQPSPLEELQGIREPTGIQELQQEREVSEVKEELKQVEGTAPETQQVEQQQSVIRRLQKFLANIFGG